MRKKRTQAAFPVSPAHSTDPHFHHDLVIQMMQMTRQQLQSIKERSIPLSADFKEPETPAQDPSWLK